MKNSDKLHMPLFFKPLTNLIISAFFGIIGVIAFFFPNLIDAEPFKIPVNWFVGIGILLILVVIFLIKYFLNVRKFNNDYDTQYGSFKSNQEALMSDNEKYIKSNKKLKTELDIRDSIILDMYTFLNATSLEPNEYEKKCLNNLLNNLNIKINNNKRNGD